MKLIIERLQGDFGDLKVHSVIEDLDVAEHERFFRKRKRNFVGNQYVRKIQFKIHLMSLAPLRDQMCPNDMIPDENVDTVSGKKISISSKYI